MAKVTVWILGDQLLDKHPALLRALERSGRESVTILMIESRLKLEGRGHHKKKLVLLLSAMRHYAQSLRDQGWSVDYRRESTFLEGLQAHKADHRPTHIISMLAASIQGRALQQSLARELSLEVELLTNTQFLIGQFTPIPKPEPGRSYRMETFYRKMRVHFDVLLDKGNPIGGRWNYDKENRKRLPKELPLPSLPAFEIDAVTEEAATEVEMDKQSIGSTSGFNLAVKREDALRALEIFLAERLPQFGPYEDAMTERSGILFHSGISAYLNIGLLEPMECIRAAETHYNSGSASIASVEGFIRQILGWREFMYWQYWRLMPGLLQQNYWGVHFPLPNMFWTGETSMQCLKFVIRRVLDHGYVHHIERLMILCNFMLLFGVEPMRANSWFLDTFIDAYDWVMPPNVIGMGLFADGGIIASKPYISSANYINRMSDYCRGCDFDSGQRTGERACPFNFLYWDFQLRNEARLRSNPRMGMAIQHLKRFSADEKERIQKQALEFRERYTSSE